MSSGMTHSHDAVRERAEDYLLGLLDEPARRELEAEAASCPVCTTELRALMDVAEGLGRLAPLRTPPASLRARVMAIPQSSAGAASVRQTRRAPIERWLAVAATIAAIVSGSYALAMRSRVASLEAELRTALARVGSAESQLAQLQESTGELRRVADVLVAADVRSVDLTGPGEVAPGASGRAFVSPERGVVLTASGLPQIPADRVYQVWFVTSKGPVSAGLFRPDAGGRAAASSNDRPGAPFTMLAVTVERAGGVAQPSNDRYYLLGKL
jgi:anti-sigma-K factor RskA